MRFRSWIANQLLTVFTLCFCVPLFKMFKRFITTCVVFYWLEDSSTVTDPERSINQGSEIEPSFRAHFFESFGLAQRNYSSLFTLQSNNNSYSLTRSHGRSITCSRAMHGEDHHHWQSRQICRYLLLKTLIYLISLFNTIISGKYMLSVPCQTFRFAHLPNFNFIFFI